MKNVMKTGSEAKKSVVTRWPRKLSLVLTLTLALLVSLTHCATCDLTLAGHGPTVVTSLDDTTSQSAPEKELPACSGHCLSHVTAQTMVSVIIPAEIVHSAPPIGREQSMTSIAGLPLFKPPRV